jgi:hypothetical protein
MRRHAAMAGIGHGFAHGLLFQRNFPMKAQPLFTSGAAAVIF